MLLVAGAAAGAINSLAGGGTLVSFPALLWLGRDPIIANATNTLALCPGALAAMAAFRHDLGPIRGWMLLLVPPALVGGLIGALLLLRTPERVFEALVPWLILFATVLFGAQGPIIAGVRRLRRQTAAHASRPEEGRVKSRRDGPRPEAWPYVVAFELAVAIYGGYFGAGIGIMTLAALGLVGFTDIHHMVSLRNFAAVANGSSGPTSDKSALCQPAAAKRPLETPSIGEETLAGCLLRRVDIFPHAGRPAPVLPFATASDNWGIRGYVNKPRNTSYRLPGSAAATVPLGGSVFG